MGQVVIVVLIAVVSVIGQIVERKLGKKSSGWVPTLQREANQGDALAQYYLGNMYESGSGDLPQDDGIATAWYRRAFACFDMGANQGDALAQYYLGNMYEHSNGVPQDYGKAIKWYRLAAEQNEEGGQFVLGLMYKAGEGVPQDYVQAYKWTKLALSKAGKAKAKFLAPLAEKMTSEQMAEAKRLARKWKPKRRKESSDSRRDDLPCLRPAREWSSKKSKERGAYDRFRAALDKRRDRAVGAVRDLEPAAQAKPMRISPVEISSPRTP